MANDVTLDLGNEYIGSAYSPVVEITENADGHTISITSADPDAAGHLVTQSFDVPNYADEEGDREAAEATRQAQEAQRIAAEDAREAAESARQAAESSRASAETSRVVAESERQGQEQGRRQAEQYRQQNETLRQQDERARQDAEAARYNAEQARAAAETARDAAESERQLAEQAREDAEDARQAAEQARETASATSVANAEAATSAANTATQQAQAATTAANDAAAAATTAAGTANTAADAADEAREGIQDDLAEMRSDIADKAFVDAYVPLLTAGAALGITGDGPTETAAWLQRTITSDGPTTVKSIHGRTLRWNQLVGTMTAGTTTHGVTAARNGDGSATLSGTGDAASTVSIAGNIGIIANHKYLIKGGLAGGSLSTYYLNVSGLGRDYGSGDIFTHPNSIPGTLRYTFAEGVTFDNAIIWPQLFDLTVMFGAGSEPSTVAEFEALYPESYYPYDAGSLLTVNITGIETEDADGDPLQTRTIPAGTLRGAGTVYDELTETERITRIGERAYQSGDESDATVVTDGTITHYPLTTPTVTTFDPPLNLIYRTETGGTERVMVPTGENSAPPTIVTAQGYTAESLRDAALATIAPVENGLASTNYAVGSYLVHGGKLCRVTTAIATGESISIGTNVTATTVMAEVIALTQ